MAGVDLEAGGKTGLDDYLAAGRSVEDLWQHVEDELRPPPEPKQKHGPSMPTGKLLGYIDNLITAHVHFRDGGEHERVALGLYVLHSWAMDAFDCTPYLYVRSPQKRAGKTRLLETIEPVCHAAMRAASITEAALFQAIAAYQPTLLIDEVDAIFAGRSERAEALRGVLNAGNRRGSPAVRGSQDGTPTTFDVFGAKVLSGIDAGNLPDTVRDRAIVIDLERKTRTEQVERWRRRDREDELAELRERLADWAAHYSEELSGYRCEPLPEISDRLEEAWEPLWAVASLVGDDYLRKAREAAVALTDNDDDGDEDLVRLLVALKRVFRDHEALWTKEVCDRLNEDEELPFGGWRNGLGIDGRGLADALRPHKIRPRSVRIGSQTAKGYKREWLEEVWERYTPESVCAQDPEDEPSQAAQRHNRSGKPSPPSQDPSQDPSQPEHVTPVVTANVTAKTASKSHCDGVTAVPDEVQPHARTRNEEPDLCAGIDPDPIAPPPLDERSTE